jgi:hypothetical protein
MRRKIPTLIALAALISTLLVGVVLYTYSRKVGQVLGEKTSRDYSIKIINLTDSSATVTWQTEKPQIGELRWGEKSTSEHTTKDDRDPDSAKPHLLHLVTLRKLKPNTSYQFQIAEGPISTPTQPLVFTTKKTAPVPAEISSQKAIIGKVIKPDQTAADEAFIFLKLANAEEIGTVTTPSGNFILPLNILRPLKESSSFTMPDTAKLVAQRGYLVSKVSVKFPLMDTLPVITLGQDEDFTYIATPSSRLIQDEASASNKLDFNQDGTVNTIDMLLIRQAINKNDLKADVNDDGVIDEKDVAAVRAAL